MRGFFESPRNKVAVVVYTTGVLCICGFLLSVLWPKEGLADAARRSIKCVAKGDAQCIFSLTLDKERSAQGITREKLALLLRDYVVPSYRGNVDTPSEQLDTLKDQGAVVAISKWPRKGLTDAVIAMHVVATLDGPRIVNTVRNIVNHVFDVKYRKNASEPAILVEIEGMEKDGGRLTAMGFSGIYNAETGSVDDWKTVIAYDRKVATDHGILK